MKNAIEIKNVDLAINKKQILKNINLNIFKNEFIAIMGPSGAGKSSLLNVISGLEKPSNGSIIINEKNDMTKLKEPRLTKFRAEEIAYIFQDYRLLDFMSLKDNILLTQKITKTKISDAKYQEVLNRLGLAKQAKSKVYQLSGGQKQRVAIARALIGNSSIIFADEPTGALDTITRDVIIHELAENARHYQKTLVVITHDPFVGSLADRVCFIKDGMIESVNEKMSEEQINIKLKEVHQNV